MNADVRARGEVGFELIPQLRRLVFDVPFHVLVARTEVAFLGARGFFVAPDTDEVAREDVFESVSTGNVVSVVQTAQMPGRGRHDRGPTDLLGTHAPLMTDSGQFFGAVQIDQYYEDLVEGSSRPWAPLQVAFFVVGAICAAMVLLSFWWSSKPVNDAEVALRLDRATIKGAIIFFVLSFALYLANIYQAKHQVAGDNKLPTVNAPAVTPSAEPAPLAVPSAQPATPPPGDAAKP